MWVSLAMIIRSISFYPNITSYVILSVNLKTKHKMWVAVAYFLTVSDHQRAVKMLWSQSNCYHFNFYFLVTLHKISLFPN